MSLSACSGTILMVVLFIAVSSAASCCAGSRGVEQRDVVGIAILTAGIGVVRAALHLIVVRAAPTGGVIEPVIARCWGGVARELGMGEDACIAGRREYGVALREGRCRRSRVASQKPSGRTGSYERSVATRTSGRWPRVVAGLTISRPFTRRCSPIIQSVSACKDAEGTHKEGATQR